MVSIEFIQNKEQTEFILEGHALDVTGKGESIACTLVTGIVSALYLSYGGVVGSGKAHITVPTLDEECCRDVADAISAFEYLERRFFNFIHIK